jgi:hypothetical protein
MHGKTSAQGPCHDGTKVLGIQPQRTQYYRETDELKMSSSISERLRLLIGLFVSYLTALNQEHSVERKST